MKFEIVWKWDFVGTFLNTVSPRDMGWEGPFRVADLYQSSLASIKSFVHRKTITNKFFTPPAAALRDMGRPGLVWQLFCVWKMSLRSYLDKKIFHLKSAADGCNTNQFIFREELQKCHKELSCLTFKTNCRFIWIEKWLQLM